MQKGKNRFQIKMQEVRIANKRKTGNGEQEK